MSLIQEALNKIVNMLQSLNLSQDFWENLILFFAGLLVGWLGKLFGGLSKLVTRYWSMRNEDGASIELEKIFQSFLAGEDLSPDEITKLSNNPHYKILISSRVKDPAFDATLKKNKVVQEIDRLEAIIQKTMLMNSADSDIG